MLHLNIQNSQEEDLGKENKSVIQAFIIELTR